MSDVRVVLITVPAGGEKSPPVAKTITRALVSEGIAACVNRVPSLKSTYIWENELQEDDEELLIVKTSARLVKRLLQRVAELHPYQVPEVLVLRVEDGLPAYLAWVLDQSGAES